MSKLSLKKDSFKQALEKAAVVIGSNPNPASLRFVKLTFDADNRLLYLESCETGGRSGVQCIMSVSMPDMLSEDFSVLIDPMIASKILGKLRSDEITLEPFDNSCKLRIKGGKNNFELNAVDPMDFPNFPKANSGKAFSINSTTLKKMLQLVQSGVDAKDPRPALTGVLFEYFGSNLYMVGMSGRLGIFASKEVKITNNDFKIIIPHYALSPLVKHLPDGEDVEVEYGLANPDDINSDIMTMFFKTSIMVVVVKAFDKQYCKYPEWNNFLAGGIKEQRAEEVHSSFLVNSEAFSELIGLASALAPAKSRRITLSYDCDKEKGVGLVNVNAWSESGRSELSDVDCHHLCGDRGFKIDLNYNLLDSLLASINTQEIQVRYNARKPLGLVCDSTSEIFVGGFILPLAEEEEEDDEEISSVEETEEAVAL